MPNHVHALVSFPDDARMVGVMGRWNAWQTRILGIDRQINFFDYRIRNDQEFELKSDYIRQNPVVKGLCAQASDWPWVSDATALESHK